MRITSGIAKGHKIMMPAGGAVRPTQDMARKAVFDIFAGEVAGARFLDLFAGTGAIGIEALSRGADFAVFVDNSRRCIEAIGRNLDKTHLSEKASIMKTDVESFLQKSDKCMGPFQIVFADPPYHERAESSSDRISLAEMTLQLVSSGDILTNDAIVAVEHSPVTVLPEKSGVLSTWKSRRYGSTSVTIYKRS